MSENLTLINQVYVALAPKGVSRDAVAKLDDKTLQEILGKLSTGGMAEEIVETIIEKAPDLADPETLQKKREIRQENGDTVIDEKNGDELAQRTIIHQEGDDVIETVIAYTNGKPSSKTIKKNGNTQETSTYSEAEIDEYGGNVVVINTDKSKSDGSQIRTIVRDVDENGNFDEDAFLQRRTQSLSGQTTFVSKNDEGNIQVKTGSDVNVYNGSSITQYDNGQLEEIVPATSPQQNVTEDKVYTSVNSMYENFNQVYDRTSFPEENHRQIFDLFDTSPKDGVLKKEEVVHIIEFVKNSLGIEDNEDIKESDIQAISKVLQNMGIENADFKGFMDNLLSGTKSNVLSTKRTALSNGRGYRTVSRYDDGRTTVRDFAPNGELLHIRYQGEKGYKDPSIAEEFGGDYIGKTLRARSAIFGNSASDETKLVNLLHKEAFSLKYCKQLQSEAIILYGMENDNVAQMLNNSTNIWQAIANLGIEGYAALVETTSLSDEEELALKNLDSFYQVRDNETVLSSQGTPDYMRIGEVSRENIERFESAFKEKFNRSFQYSLVEPLTQSYSDYTETVSLYQSIQNIDDVLSLMPGKNSGIIDRNKKLSPTGSIDDVASELMRYGFTVKFVDNPDDIPHFQEKRDAHIYLSRKDVLLGQGENLKAKKLLTLCQMLGQDNPLLEELNDPKYFNPEYINTGETDFWGLQLRNIETNLKSTMAQKVGKHFHSEDNNEFSEDKTEEYIQNLYNRYAEYYSGLFGQKPPDKEHIEDLLMAREITAQAVEMAVVMALTNGLGSAISTEMAIGVNAAKAGENANGAAGMFKWIASKYGDNAARQFAAHLTKVTGVALFPAVNYATAVGDEGRAAALDTAPESLAYGLFGSYVSGPFGDAVKGILGSQNEALCARILNNAIGFSGEITADAIFESIASGENIVESLGSNSQGEMMGRMLSMLVGGRANKASHMSSKYKIEIEIKDGQKNYVVSQNGQVLCSTPRPEEIVTGILAKEVSENMREKVSAEKTRISDDDREKVVPEQTDKQESVSDIVGRNPETVSSETAEDKTSADRTEVKENPTETLTNVEQSSDYEGMLVEEVPTHEQKMLKYRFSESELKYLDEIWQNHPDLVEGLIRVNQYGKTLTFASIQKIINEALKDNSASVEQNRIDEAILEQGIKFYSDNQEGCIRFTDSEEAYLKSAMRSQPELVIKLLYSRKNSQTLSFQNIQKIINEAIRLRENFAGVEQNMIDNAYFEQEIGRFSESEQAELKSMSTDNPEVIRRLVGIRDQGEPLSFAEIERIVNESAQLKEEIPNVDQATLADMLSLFSPENIPEFFSKYDITDATQLKLLDECLSDIHSLNVTNVTTVQDLIYHYEFKSKSNTPNVGGYYSALADGYLNIKDPKIKEEVYRLVKEAESTSYRFYLDDALALVDTVNNMNGNYSTLVGTYHTNFTSNGSYNRDPKYTEYEPHITFSHYLKSEFGMDMETAKDAYFSKEYDDFMVDAKFSRMIEYIKKNPNSEMSEYLYDNYYIQHLEETNVPKNIIDKCIEINKKYKVKIKLPSDISLPERAFEYIEKELDLWAEASNRQAKYPPVIDFSSARANWQRGAGGYTESGYNGAQAYPEMTLDALMDAMRHELTHTNDLKLGKNIDPKYNLDEILPHHKEIVDGKPKRVSDPRKCPFYSELKSLGFSDFKIAYACKNTKEFIAVCSEGPLNKYSPELKQVLIDFGMPEWMFNLKAHDVKPID